MEENRAYKYEPVNFDLSRFYGREFILSQTVLEDTTYTLMVKVIEDTKDLEEMEVLSQIWDIIVRVKSPTRNHDITLYAPHITPDSSQRLSFIPDETYIQDYTDRELEQINHAHEILMRNSWHTIFSTVARTRWQQHRRSLITDEEGDLLRKYNPHYHKRAAYLLHFAHIQPLQTAHLALSLFDTATQDQDPSNWASAQEFENLARLALS